MVKFNSVSNSFLSIIFFIKNKNNDLVSFQNGVDTIVDGCTTYGSTPSSNTPSSIVTSIKNIYNNRYNAGVTATKKGNATAAQVLSGKTFTNSSSVGISGSMTNNGAVNKTIKPSTSAQTYTIPAGYHNGSGKVTVSAIVGASGAYAYYFNTCKANRSISYPPGFNKNNTKVVCCKCWRDDDQAFYNESYTLNNNNITYGSYNYSWGVWAVNLLVIQRTDI